MSGDREEHARRVAGSLAAALRQQQELGVTGVPVDVARRLHNWVKNAPGLLAASAGPPASAGVARRVAEGGGASPPTESVALNRSEDPRADASREESRLRRESAAQRPGRALAAQSAAASATSADRPQAAVDTGAMQAPPARPKATSRSAARPPYARRGNAGETLGLGSPALETIRADLGDCERCGLCQRRSNIVFGVGHPSARLMFIGEAPGEKEDRVGEPFVGAAGELLTKMIGAMGLSRSEVYIANVVKCRPPANRDPSADEVAACLPFLKRQVAAVAPEVIVTLGRVAPEALLAKSVRITEERGTWTEFEQVPTMLTLHPAYLLRKPAAKRDAWGDLQQVMKRLGLERR